MKSLVPEISSSDSDEAELGRCLKRKKMGGAVDEPRHTFFMALSTLSSAGQKEWIDGGGGSDAVFLSSSAQIPVHPRFGPLVQEMARWEGEMGGAVFTFNVDAHNKRRYHPEFKHDGMKREKQGPALTATCMAPGCEGSKPYKIDYTIRSR
jgi:hypothetical protein